MHICHQHSLMWWPVPGRMVFPKAISFVFTASGIIGIRTIKPLQDTREVHKEKRELATGDGRCVFLTSWRLQEQIDPMLPGREQWEMGSRGSRGSMLPSLEQAWHRSEELTKRESGET